MRSATRPLHHAGPLTQLLDLRRVHRQAGHEVELVLVGAVWRQMHDTVLAETGDPAAGDTLFARLYKNDGSHPSTLGTYLAALTFHASLTGESPVGLEWAHAGIAQEDKALLQAAAASLLPEKEESVDSEESAESRDTVDPVHGP